MITSTTVLFCSLNIILMKATLVGFRVTGKWYGSECPVGSSRMEKNQNSKLLNENFTGEVNLGVAGRIWVKIQGRECF